MKKRFSLSCVSFLLLSRFLLAQSYSLQVEIKNHPYNHVIIGMISGDKLIGADTVETRNIMTAKGPKKMIYRDFPSGAQAGMYRINFGQTKYAKIMNESPQQLDFIFNNENVRLETDFKAPVDSLEVVASEENKAWFAFLQQEMQYRKQLKDLEMEVDYYRGKAGEPSAGSGNEASEGFEARAASVANTFNLLQLERDRFISDAISTNQHLLASRLMQIFREPFRDGYFTETERNASWQENYFRYINFSDETLIHSPFFSDKIFNYLVTYNEKGFTHEQREKAYIKAVDAVMQKVEADAGRGGPVYEFVLDYLTDGFEGLKMTNVLLWIADKYAGSLCKSEDKTTLMRKLEAQKMKPGVVVPDFTLNDLAGRPIVLSEVLKKRNLLIFWASWCPHCNDILPQVKVLCSGRNDMEVVAVALDKSGDEWHKAVYRAGFENFKNLSDLMEWDGQVAEDYNIYATPTMFLIDGNRKILARPFTVGELKEALDKY